MHRCDMNRCLTGCPIARGEAVLGDSFRSRLLALPEIASWPEMVKIVNEESRVEPAFTRYPLLAAQAVGGDPHLALAGSTAIFCALLSIHLVDDMLDEDPAGAHQELGSAQAANLAAAFQAAGLQLLARTVPEPRARAAALARLAQTFLQTAYGQSLPGGGEEAYWRAVECRTPPLIGAALYLGAILGGAPLALAEDLADLSVELGKIIQVHDDVRDAMAVPAAPDWRSGKQNLPILYALTVEHAERPCFQAMLAQIDQPEVLVAAQKTLVRCGAIGFCCYQLASFDRRARERLAALPLVHPEPLIGLFEHYAEPVRKLLAAAGADGFDSR